MQVEGKATFVYNVTMTEDEARIIKRMIMCFTSRDNDLRQKIRRMEDCFANNGVNDASRHLEVESGGSTAVEVLNMNRTAQ